LLEVFFLIHDPTTLNRQGNDVGSQYRSGIYVERDEQRAVAAAVMAEVQAHLKDPVVTELEPLRASGLPRTTTSTTSPSTRARATAPSWWRPRWRSSAAP
jgi:hypothetical protein